MHYFKIKANVYSMKKARRLAVVSGDAGIYQTDSFSEPFEVEDYLKKLKIEHSGVTRMQIKK